MAQRTVIGLFLQRLKKYLQKYGMVAILLA